MEDIITDSGTIIKHCGDDEILSLFFSKLSTIYGFTGSGKSFFVNTVLEQLQTVTPKWMIFCKTEDESPSYSKQNGDGVTKAPLSCIFTSLEISNLEKILELQKGVVGLWKTSNELDVLKRIFNRVCSPQSKKEYSQLEKAINEADDESDKFEKLSHYKKARAMKNFITRDYDGSGLNEEDTLMFDRFDTNPNLGIIMDDLAGEISNMCSSKNTGKVFFESLSYNIRHNNTSVMVMSQDINIWSTAVRKNCHTNVFVSLDDARNFFKNSSVGFSSELRYEAEGVIRKLEELGDHRVLIYARRGTADHQFFYTIGKTKTSVKLGSDCLYKMDDMVVEKNKSKSVNNKFINDLV